METDLYSPELAVDLRVASDVQLSPDGKMVAFCVAPIGHHDRHPTSAIYIAPSDGARPPYALTSNRSNNISPRWSPDSSMLAFLSDRDSRGTAQLFVTRVDGGQPTRLTEYEGGVKSPAWMRDGKRMLFTVRRRDLTTERPPVSEVFVASESARPHTVATTSIYGGLSAALGPPRGHVWTFALSPDGTQIAALISPTDDLAAAANQTWLIAFPLADPSQPRTLCRFVTNVEQLAWSPDNRYVVLVNGSTGTTREPHVQVIDMIDGTLTTHDDHNRTPTWAGFGHDGLVVLSVDAQRSRLDHFAYDGRRQQQLNLSGPASDCWIQPQISMSADGQRLAFLGATPSRPSDVFVTDANGSSHRISDLNSHLSGVQLADMEEVNWDGPGGVRIHGWLLRPTQGSGQEPYPLVVNVHGGPSMAWGNWFHGTWHDWGQVLAARGYAVLLPNPRGSTGKGESFTLANRADLGGHDYQDVMAGIDNLIECGVANSERLGIGGWSYGGFLTAIAIVRSKRFKAAVAGAAVTNWASKVGTTDIRPYNEWNFPGPLHKTPDPYWIRSPVRYLRNARTPTLIVHGQADNRVPVSQGHELFLGLKALGVDTDFVTYPRQGHAFHERAFQLDLLQRVCRWFDRYLTPEEAT